MMMMTMMTNTIPYRRTKTHIWDKVLMGFLVHPIMIATIIINMIIIIRWCSFWTSSPSPARRRWTWRSGLPWSVWKKRKKKKEKKKKGKNDRSEKRKRKKGKMIGHELLSQNELSPPSYRNDWSQLHHYQNHNRGVTGKYNRSLKLWLLWYTQAISVMLAGRELSLGRTLINSVRRISGERNCSGR